MALFNQWFWGNYWPGTNMHELDLDWLLNEIRKMENEIDLFEKKVLEDLQTEIGKFRDEFNEKLETFEQEMMEDIDNKFAEKMQEVQEELDAFEQKIENRLTDFETNVIGPIKVDIENLQDTVGEHTTQIQGLKLNVDINTSSIRKNAADILNISSYNAYVQNMLDKHTEQIDILSVSYHRMSERVDFTQETMAREHFANLQMRQKLEADMRNLNSSVSAFVNSNVSSLTAFVTRHDASITAYVDTNMSSITSYVDKEVNELRELVHVNSSSVAGFVQEQMDEMRNYVDTEVAKVNVSSILGYVDKQDRAYESSMIAYVDAKVGDTSSIVSYVNTHINEVKDELNTVEDVATEALADANSALYPQYRGTNYGSPDIALPASISFNVYGFIHLEVYARTGYTVDINVTYLYATYYFIVDSAMRHAITLPIFPGTFMNVNGDRSHALCHYVLLQQTNVPSTINNKYPLMYLDDSGEWQEMPLEKNSED